MPQVVAFIPAIAAAAGAAGATLAVITVASAVVGGVLTAMQARKQAAKARDAYNASLRDRTQMVRNTTEGRDLVLGRVRKSGQLSFIGSTGETKDKLVMVIALAGHEIDAVEEIYFFDEKVTIDGEDRVTSDPYVKRKKKSASARLNIDVGTGNGSVTLPFDPIDGSVHLVHPRTNLPGSINSTMYEDFTVDGRTVTVTGLEGGLGYLIVQYQYTEEKYRAKVWWHLGTASQAADARIMELFPDEWTAAHRLRGIAYLVCELSYDDDAFPSGIPNVSATIRGAKVLDPRTGTTAWSENPALLARCLATHALGGRLPASSINDAAVIASANACDEVTTYKERKTDGTLTSVSRKIYTAGYVHKSGGKPREGLDDLTQAMAGKWVFTGNKLTIKAGIYTAPVLSLGDDDFLDTAAVRVAPTRPREELANVVTGTFADEDNAYRLVDFPRVVADEYIAIDGAELPAEVELGAVTYAPQAQHVSVVSLRDKRQALVVTAAFKMRAYPLEVLDTVSLTSSRFGWLNKPFEVLARRWTLDGGIELTLKETASSIFVKNDEFPRVDPAPNTRLPRPWQLREVLSFAATSNMTTLADGTPQTRVKLTWAEHRDQAVLESGSIEIAYAPADEDAPVEEWPSVLVAGSSRTYTITGLSLGGAYLFRARAVTSIARSDWSKQVAIVVASVPIPPGKSMRLRATASVFKVDPSGTPSPNSLTISAQLVGFAGTVDWSIVSGTATLGGSGNSRTLSFANMVSESLTVQAEIEHEGYTFTDTVGIVKLRDGLDGAPGIDGASPGLLVLSATSQVFAINKAGGVSPGAITLTAREENLTGTPTFAITAGSATLTGTGNSRALDYDDMTTDAVTVQVSLAGFTDSVTIVKLREGLDGGEAAQGQPAVVGVLSNEAHTLPADSSGTVLTYGGAQTTMSVFVGLTDDTANWAFTRANSANVASSIVGNLVTITSLTADTGYVDLTATRAGYPTQRKRFTLTRSRAGSPGSQGAPGAPAKTLAIKATSQVFAVAKSGVPTPDAIVLSAAGQNLGGAPVFGITEGTALLSGTGATRTLAFNDMQTDAVTIQVTQDGLADTVTIVKLREGSDGGTGAPGSPGAAALVSLLTNESHVLPASNTGVVSSYAGASTSIVIYRGLTDESALWTISKADSAGVTSSLSGRTVTVTALGAATESGFVDITATRAGYPTQTKRFSLSKSRAGVQGDPGAPGTPGAPGEPGAPGSPGAPAVSGVLSAEVAVFPADAAGAVTSYVGNVSTMRVFIGATDDSASWTFSHVASAGVSVTRTGATVTVTSIAASTPSGYVDITAAKAGYSPVTKRFKISKAIKGQTGNTGQTGAKGADGLDGRRGSVDASRAVTTTAWSDSQANAAISAAGYGAPVILDRVTLYNAAAGYVETRVFNGSLWAPYAALVNGNLLVNGSVIASALDVATLSSIAANIGTITAGILRNATGTTVLNLNATGSQAVLAIGNALRVLANGSAVFGGTLSAEVVETDNLVGEAATAGRGAELVTTTDVGSTYTTLASSTLSTGGKPAVVIGSFTVQSTTGFGQTGAGVRVLVNGVVERTVGPFDVLGPESHTLVAFVPVPPTTAFTIAIQARNCRAVGGGACNVVGMALKR